MFVPPSYFSLSCEPQTCFRSSLLSLRKITSANRSGKTIPWCKTFCFDVGQSDQRIEYSSSDSSRPRSWILTRVTKYALEGEFNDYNGALHDTGATFAPARVHCGSLSWLYICLHDTTTKYHAGTSHPGVSSPRLLYQGENFTPVRNLATVSCKREMTNRFGVKSVCE